MNQSKHQSEKLGDDFVLQGLHIPKDVFAGSLERDPVRNTALLKHPQPECNDSGTEHDPVVDVMNAGSPYR